MGINFPSSPTEGQKLVSGNALYTFTGGLWQASQLSTALPKNYIVNPAMAVSLQNGDAASTANSYYVADQWLISRNTPTGVTNVWRLAGATPNGSMHRFHVGVSVAQAVISASEWCSIFQYIEANRMIDFGWSMGAPARKPVVLRFGFVGKAGTYSACIRDSLGTTNWVAPFTIAPIQADTFTEQVFAVPPPPAGTWPRNNTKAIELWVTLAAGPSLTAPGSGWYTSPTYIAAVGQSNGLASTANSFDLYDVGLYLDPDGTGRAPPWQAEPLLNVRQDCGRYYQQQAYSQGVGYNVASNTPLRTGSINQVPMRVAPSTILIGSMGASDTTGYALTAIPGAATNEYVAEHDCQSTGPHVAGRAVIVYQNNSTSWIGLNARM